MIGLKTCLSCWIYVRQNEGAKFFSNFNPFDTTKEMLFLPVYEWIVNLTKFTTEILVNRKIVDLYFSYFFFSDVLVRCSSLLGFCYINAAPSEEHYMHRSKTVKMVAKFSIIALSCIFVVQVIQNTYILHLFYSNHLILSKLENLIGSFGLWFRLYVARLWYLYV